MIARVGLLDQQQIGFTAGAVARAAAAQRAPALSQEPVGVLLRVPPPTAGMTEGLRYFGMGIGGSRYFETIGRISGGPVYLGMPAWTMEGVHFFDLDDQSPLLAGGSTTHPAAARDLPRGVRRPALSSTMQQRDLVSRVTAIRDLLQREQVSAARRLLELIPAEAFEEPGIGDLRRALTPPTVRPSARKDIDRTRAYEWLRQHAHERKGQWVAVGDDGLIASALTLKDLREQLRTLAPPRQPLIHKL